MYELRHQLHSHRFTIQTEDEELAELCSQLYPNSRCEGNDGSVDIVYALEEGKSSNGDRLYEVFENGVKKCEKDRKSKLFSRLEWMITCNALSHLQEFFQLHAGAVVKDGKAILLPAEHGRGKTTLTTNLIHNGYHCLADDIVLLEPNTLSLYSFPRCFMVKGDGIKLLNKINVKENSYGYYCDYRDILYLDPATVNGSLVAKAEPFAIIDLTYDRNSESELKRLSMSKTCMVLLERSMNIDKYKRKGVAALTGLARRSKCYSLTINNIQDAVKLLSHI
ncbi:MAG: hypothetical protein D8M57_08570 [Candidatus Scalindua sp. AMX11]|nr:MAG: hypothetical protein DWQ00_05420 [Candidatus Scalindua sp.]NOG84396.1 hypothetical protein [Planctomycetota bacterium]RZV65753.1 MAG: hypothetical protein EX341_17775 [Candidatus Scalindua sp. SCAELEC01]TDE65397.1 MAG: hypothetical protein D8M57_08570 [Candidatus Scalindua sp. AMX11]GJQ60345.1 MAG: hypothetical protein SCALA701_31460 [Candidatus Scalindua sp.]